MSYYIRAQGVLEHIGDVRKPPNEALRKVGESSLKLSLIGQMEQTQTDVKLIHSQGSATHFGSWSLMFTFAVRHPAQKVPSMRMR